MVKTQLTSASNSEEFYNKLIELKNEQKKTLLYMQDLYNQKQILKDGILKSEAALNDLKSTTYPLNGETYKYDITTVSAYENRPINFDIVDSVESVEINQNKVSKKPPIPHKLTSSVSFQNTTTTINDKTEDDINEDLKKIEKIWNEFKMDESNLSDLKSLEFNNRFEKKRVRSAAATTSSLRRSKSRNSFQYEWFPRVTIPEPFSMTIREQIKNEQKQQKLAREMQDEREKRIDAEIKECNRKFKANPVPAHVYLPLYEKHKMNEELRKEKLKKSSKDYMDKVSRPFNLTKKKITGTDSLRERRHSYSEGTETQTEFVAQPLPEFYFADEELLER
jgi:hypothetical protein